METNPEHLQPLPGQPAETAETTAHQHSLTARLGTIAYSAYEAAQSWTDRQRVIVMAAVAMGGGLAGATTAELAFTNPAGAENVPTATDSNANHNFMSANLTPEERQCAKIAVSIVKDPKDGYTMYHAGIRDGTTGLRHHETELIKGRYFTKNLPDGSEPGELNCSGIQQWENDQLDMQSPRNRKIWINLTPQLINGKWSHPKSFPVANSNNPNGIGAIGPEGWTPSFIGTRWMYNQCPDGKHWLKVRAKTALMARAVQTGQFIAKHVYTWPVKVRGSCAAAARSARAAERILREGSQ